MAIEPQMTALSPEEPAGRDPSLKDVQRLKTDFCDAIEVANEARKLAFRDLDYYHNFNDSQWTEEEKKELKARNQPIVSSNWIKRRILFAEGMEQRTRTDPKAWPKRPNATDQAEVATKVLNDIETNTRFDRTASRAFRDLAIMGAEIGEVVWNGREIEVNRIPFRKFFCDPRTMMEDYSSARFMGYVDWFDAEEVRELFAGAPNLEEAISGSYAEGELEKGYEDKPDNWGDRTRERVRVVVMYYKTGRSEWNYAYFTGGGILKEGRSPYIDSDGKTQNPIIAQAVYMTEDNEVYGLVRDMVSLQREVNMRRSLSLSLLKDRRLWAMDEGVFPNPEAAKREVAKSNGILIARGRFGEAWGFVESQTEISGNLELLQEAKSELQIQQANAALQGREVSGQSGVAIQAQQSAGMTEDNSIYDAHNDWKRRIYRAMWNAARQFWTEEQFIRMTDDEGQVQFLGVNQQVPTGQIDPMTGQPQMAIQNQLATMDVDIDIETAPDFVTMQHETFARLTELAQAGVQIPPEAILAAMPQFPDKKKVENLIKQAAEAQAPIIQANTQLDLAQKEADVTKTKAEAMNKNADTANKLHPEPKPTPNINGKAA